MLMLNLRCNICEEISESNQSCEELETAEVDEIHPELYFCEKCFNAVEVDAPNRPAAQSQIEPG